MFSEPTIQTHAEKTYVAIRSQVPMQGLSSVIPQSIGEVAGWLAKQSKAPAGPPFVRYNVIDMARELEIEAGWPVAMAIAGAGRIAAGAVPAGRYVTLMFTGEYKGLEQATASLLAWVAQNNLRMDSHPSERGEVFGGRFEWYLTDPAIEPNPAKWQTEIAMRLAV